MNNFNQVANTSYNPSMLDTGVINPSMETTNTINPNQVQPSAINPRLFSNMNTINNLNPGSTYNQSQPVMPPSGVQTSITPALGIENQ